MLCSLTLLFFHSVKTALPLFILFLAHLNVSIRLSVVTFRFGWLKYFILLLCLIENNQFICFVHFSGSDGFLWKYVVVLVTVHYVCWWGECKLPHHCVREYFTGKKWIPDRFPLSLDYFSYCSILFNHSLGQCHYTGTDRVCCITVPTIGYTSHVNADHLTEKSMQILHHKNKFMYILSIQE